MGEIGDNDDAVERAARAMYDVVQPEWSWADPDAELLRRMYRANARAVLLSVRDPGSSFDPVRVVIWQEMIDTLLGTESLPDGS